MNTLSSTQILAVLRARWRVALGVFVVVVVLAVAGSLSIAKKYTATASVVLDVKSPDPIAGVVLPGMTVVGYMATQIGVLQSERVALRAVQALRLENDTAWREAWLAETGGRGVLRNWLADQLLRKVDAVPARDSNVITVSYTAKDPQFAADAANAFVKAYIDTVLELRVEPARRYNNLFDGRAKQLREEVEQAQARLSAYQQQHGILVTDEKLDVENARLAEMSSQMVALQALADESSSRKTQASASPERTQEVLASPLVVTLTADLSRQQARLNELSQRLGDNHPQVQELRANINELSARIASESGRITGSMTVNNNVNQSRLAQLRANLEQQRATLLRMRSQRDEVNVLSRDVENAKRAYEAVATRVNDTGLESQATQTNVSVLKDATPPPLPSAPRVPLNIAIGVLIGALLGAAAAIVRELRDPRLRTDEDVLVQLQMPLFGVLPNRPADAGRTQSRRDLMQKRLIAMLPQVAGPRPSTS